MEPKPVAELPKFEKRRKDLERQVARLHEDLDLEKGSKKTLQEKLDAATAELAKLKPAEVPVAKIEELVRPKRPTKADADYDEEKYEALMDAYEVERDEYTRKMVQRETEEARAKDEKQRKEREDTAAVAKAEQDFVGRLQEDVKGIPDYDDVVAEFNEATDGREIEVPKTIETFIQISAEHPGQMMHFLLKDYLQNDGKELARLAALNPYVQMRELTRLSDRLEKEYAGTTTAASAGSPVVDVPPAAAPAKAPESPVKPKITPKVHEDPITPVGARSAGPVQTLEAAGKKGAVAYIMARNAGVNR